MTDTHKERLEAAAKAAKELSLQRRKFCELLSVDPRRSQAAAARGAGYHHATVMGSRLMRMPKVLAYLEALYLVAAGIASETSPGPPPPPSVPNPAEVARREYALANHILGVAMEEAEIMQRLSDHARVNIMDFVSYEPATDATGTMMLTSDGHPVYRPFVDIGKIEALGKGHLVKKIKGGRYGTEIELVDSQGALKTLANIAGLTDGDAEGGEDGPRRRTWREFLKSLPPDVLLSMHRKMLGFGGSAIDIAAVPVPGTGGNGGNGNGNGHGA